MAAISMEDILLVLTTKIVVFCEHEIASYLKSPTLHAPVVYMGLVNKVYKGLVQVYSVDFPER